MKFRLKFLLPATILAALGVTFAAAPRTVFRAASDLWGWRYNLPQTAPAPTKFANKNSHGAADRVRHWNETAINASGLDHTPVQPGEHRVFGEQVGPVRAARAMAIVHIAVFEAVNAIGGNCKSYLGVAPASFPATSMNCAIAQAAHDT
jgi:hypothetical protein